jgi:lysozyme
MTRDILDWLKSNEGFRAYPYHCPAGYLTIGYGRNIEQRGITNEEAEYLLRQDILLCRQEMEAFPWYYGQPPSVRDALVNMCYNLGLPTLLKFKRMLTALEAHDYHTAAEEALNSRWAKQVGKRAREVADMIRSAAPDGH